MPGILWKWAKTHCGPEQPFGLQSLDPNSISKVTESNQQLEFDSWLFMEALICPTFWCFQQTSVASWIQDRAQSWALQEFKSLVGLQGGLCGAAYLCQIGDADHMRPLGIFSNLENVCKSIHRGWPNLVSTVIDHSPTLSYTGPLQKTCPCVQNHKALRRASLDGHFLSHSGAGLSSTVLENSVFRNWKLPTPSGQGRRVGTQFLTAWNHSNKGSFPSLASAVSSLSILYKRWKEGKLSRNILKAFVLGEDPELFFKQRTDGLLTDVHGLNCTVVSWPPVSYSSDLDVGARTPRKRSVGRSTSSRLMRERSRTPRTTKGSLVPSEPRGVSDGNGGRALQLASGGDVSVSTPGVESGRAVGSSGSGPCFCPVSLKSGARH